MAESPASAPAAPGIDPRPNSAVKPAYPLGPLPGLRRPDFAMSSPMTQPTTSQVASPILAAEKVAMDEHPETPTDGGAKLAHSESALTPPDSNKAQLAATFQNKASTEPVNPSNADNTSNLLKKEFIKKTEGVTVEDPFITPGPRDTKSGSSTTLFAADKLVSPNPIRADRLGVPVTPENAQGVLPPENAVFVANLSNQKNDQELELAVSQAFGKFGTCHVKIRRDKNRMPFAFAIYQLEEDARKAIIQGRGITLHGRKIRTEHAKVERTLILSRVTGGQLSESQAHEVLDPYGAIEWMGGITDRDVAIFGLTEGVWIKFAYYEDSRDAIMAFKHHEEFKLLPAKYYHTPSQAPCETSGSPPTGRNDENYVDSYLVTQQVPDGCAIFVGNLPPDVTEQHLFNVFSEYGQVVSVDIIHKPMPHHDRVNTFAFIGYNTPQEAHNAVGKHVAIGQWKVRVEPKEYNHRRNQRLLANAGSRNIQFGQESQVLDHLYAEGINMGLPRETASRILTINQPTQPADAAFYGRPAMRMAPLVSHGYINNGSPAINYGDPPAASFGGSPAGPYRGSPMPIWPFPAMALTNTPMHAGISAGSPYHHPQHALQTSPTPNAYPVHPGQAHMSYVMNTQGYDLMAQHHLRPAVVGSYSFTGTANNHTQGVEQTDGPAELNASHDTPTNNDESTEPINGIADA